MAAVVTDSAAPRGLARFAWAALAYNLLVVLWGAFVRATGSGAGCGRHWPLCNGEIAPRIASTKTAIELSHRVTSGLSVLVVIALYVWARRSLAPGHRARRAAGLSVVLSLGEALIGGVLVLLELVAHDASLKRGVSSILHLGNTFFLLAALVLAAWLMPGGVRRASRDAPLPRVATVAAFVSCAAVLFLGASGAIAALGDTLFPSRSLAEGFADDLSPTAHLFIRLRAVHPFLALASAAVVVATAALLRAARPTPRVRLLATILVALFVGQIALGVANLVLLAPVWMQLVHLLSADAVWLVLVLLTWEAARGDDGARDQPPMSSRNGPGPRSEVPPSTSNVVPVTYAPAGDTR